MTKTLFLAWQDHVKTRGWYPIGRLDADPSAQTYSFRYVRGAQRAYTEAGFKPLESFPQLNTTYTSKELFPIFLNRVLSRGRSDFNEWVEQLALSPETADPIDLLSLSGGARQTDSLEVFPKIEPQADGGFKCRFFLHGNHHVNENARERIKKLVAGEQLQVAIELNNPATELALQLQTGNNDYHMIGWAPRYLIDDFILAISKTHSKLLAHVVRLNPEPAPSKQRVLIEIAGILPHGYQPMTVGDYLPLN
jgi:hypothetical protein